MKNYPINEVKNMRLLGRNVAGGICKDGAVRLFWAGAALEVAVKAREVWAEISCNYDFQEIWLAVEVNGAQISRFLAPKRPAWVCLARNLNPEKENLISLIKDTQPMPGDNLHELKITGLRLDDAGEFITPKPRSCKIEFIGDSLTSGEGLAGGPDEMDWISQWMCASKTYAVQLAKKMNADWSTISQCGWGLCWGWDGDVTASIPMYYQQVCGVLSGEQQQAMGSCDVVPYNNGADYVILNLGTNDNSGFMSQDDGKGAAGVAGKAIVAEVKRFLGEIRRYNPDAKIIWTWGMLSLDIVPSLIQTGIKEYIKETSDMNVYPLELEGMDKLEKTEEDKGSRGHPGLITHRKAAERIYDFIKTLKA